MPVCFTGMKSREFEMEDRSSSIKVGLLNLKMKLSFFQTDVNHLRNFTDFRKKMKVKHC